MKKSRFTDSQIMDALKRAEAGIKVPDLCRELGTRAAIFVTSSRGVSTSAAGQAPGVRRACAGRRSAPRLRVTVDQMLSIALMQMFQREGRTRAGFRHFAD